MKRTRTPQTRSWRYFAIGAGIVGVLALIVVLFPWNMLRGPLAHYASARFDRTVAIDGDLVVDLGWTTRVQIDGVSIANIAWSQEQPMVAAQRVILWFTPMALLRVEPTRARLIDTRVSLEKNADGEDNWHLGHITPSRIGNVDVDRGIVRYRDAKQRADLTLDLQSMEPAGDPSRNPVAGLRLSGRGSFHGEAVQVEGESVGLAQLQDTNDPYRLKLEIKAGRTVGQFRRHRHSVQHRRRARRPARAGARPLQALPSRSGAAAMDRRLQPHRRARAHQGRVGSCAGSRERLARAISRVTFGSTCRSHAP